MGQADKFSIGAERLWFESIVLNSPARHGTVIVREANGTDPSLDFLQRGVTGEYLMVIACGMRVDRFGPRRMVQQPQPRGKYLLLVRQKLYTSLSNPLKKLIARTGRTWGYYEEKNMALERLQLIQTLCTLTSKSSGLLNQGRLLHPKLGNKRRRVRGIQFSCRLSRIPVRTEHKTARPEVQVSILTLHQHCCSRNTSLSSSVPVFISTAMINMITKVATTHPCCMRKPCRAYPVA
jgi:hypothetical protein